MITLKSADSLLSREEMKSINGGGRSFCESDDCCEEGCMELVDDSWQCSGCCIAGGSGGGISAIK